jgi:hypothetical protein
MNMNALTSGNDIRELTEIDLNAVAGGLAPGQGDHLDPSVVTGHVWHGPIVLSNPDRIRLIGPTV